MCILYFTTLVVSLLELNDLHWTICICLQSFANIKKIICSNFQNPHFLCPKNILWLSVIFLRAFFKFNSSTNAVCHKTDSTGSEAI